MIVTIPVYSDALLNVFVQIIKSVLVMFIHFPLS